MSKRIIAPPSYTSLPSIGEITLDEPTITEKTSNPGETAILSQKSTESISQTNDLPYISPPNAPPVFLAPFDGYYVTPLTTPYATAPNTPMVPGMPCMPGMITGTMFNYPVQHCQSIQQQGAIYMQPTYMAGGVHTQPMCIPKDPASAPINVVINSNATSNGNDNGYGNRLCPKCRRGLIERKQNKIRQIFIIALGALTMCCLCGSLCLLLKNNYEDQCSFCGKNYGHRGTKVEKPKKKKI